MKISLRYLLTGSVLTGILILPVLLLRPKLPGRETARAEAQSRSKGPENAPIIIIEYSDFQCPACANVQPLLRSFMADHAEKIRLTYQHFPLQSHAWSPWAHLTAECAARQGNFWSFHDKLYASQAEWSKSKEPPLKTFMGFAYETGLNMDAFARCLSDPKPAEVIREETLAGEGMGVRSTPSFFVNGEMILGTDKLAERLSELVKK